MKIITNGIDKLMTAVGYQSKTECSDKRANLLFNYWCFFEENEQDIQRLANASLEIVLYSKYYWCTRYKQRFNALYGTNAGLDQQQFKIIEEISQRIANVNWALIQRIEETD